jgi:hypothetical protein
MVNNWYIIENNGMTIVKKIVEKIKNTHFVFSNWCVSSKGRRSAIMHMAVVTRTLIDVVPD